MVCWARDRDHRERYVAVPTVESKALSETQPAFQRHRGLPRSPLGSTGQPRDQQAQREREFWSSNRIPHKARAEGCLAGNTNQAGRTVCAKSN
jgi:hypothetical protein